MRNLRYLLILLVLAGCGQPQNSDSAEKSDSQKKHKDSTIAVNKPTVNYLELPSNKIYIDSLRPFFCFHDIVRLDSLWEKAKTLPPINMKQVVFQNGNIISAVRKDTISISDDIFLLGNLKKKENYLDILLFKYSNMYWGSGLLIVSIDKHNTIFDAAVLWSEGGDGGYYSKTNVSYINFKKYIFRQTDGCFPDVIAPNTIEYEKHSLKCFELNGNSTFKIYTISKDSIIIQKNNN